MLMLNVDWSELYEIISGDAWIKIQFSLKKID